MDASSDEPGVRIRKGLMVASNVTSPLVDCDLPGPGTAIAVLWIQDSISYWLHDGFSQVCNRWLV